MCYSRGLLYLIAGVGVVVSVHAASPARADDLAASTFLLDYNFAAKAPGASKVDTSNVAAFADVLPPTVVDLIKAGDLEIALQPGTSFSPSPGYIDATRQNDGKTAFDETGGKLVNYVGGRPFPQVLDPADPQAGRLLAWNIRYADGGDSGTVDPMVWKYIDMPSAKVERTIGMRASKLSYLYRVSDKEHPSLEPNPSGIFRAMYLSIDEPLDVKGTQLLIHRLADDHAREQTWLYLSSQRRVRLLSSGETTDAFLGSDIMIEDFLGYNGRLSDQEWKLLGKKDLLLPLYVSSTGADVSYGGAGNCYPSTPWELRPGYVLEGKPIDPHHPLSKRIFYVDAQTSYIMVTEIFDRADRLWKLGFASLAHPDSHLPENKGSHIPALAAVSMSDLQARHCTVIVPTAHNLVEASPTDFTVNSLRARGR